MQMDNATFEDVKKFFTFALRGGFIYLNGMELSKIYHMFLTGIELISKSGRCCKIFPIGMNYFTFSDATLERVCLFEKLHQGCINSSEVARLSFLAGLMSQEQYADYLNIERECGKS